jgi:hypothetical protein
MAWRAEHEDSGMGSAEVPPEDLKLMEKTEDPDELAATSRGSFWPTEPPRRRCPREYEPLAALPDFPGTSVTSKPSSTATSAVASRGPRAGRHSVRLGESSTGRATARSTTSCERLD